MDYIRRSDDRGAANFGWLQSKHSFSFGNYYDPQHMGFSVLRVINDDQVAPGGGFDTHPHKDMEIISYITNGAIEHKDSMGNIHTVSAGEVQRMTAGTGITHSEYNASATDPLHFLQIWIIPQEKGLTPGYEQKEIHQADKLTPLVTPDGRDSTLLVHQDAHMSRLVLQADDSETLETSNRLGYLHIVAGEATINGETFFAGDAVGILPGKTLTIQATEQIEALWFDLPPVH